MKINCKWAVALLPLFLAGCEDKMDQPAPSIAYEGDDVRFSVDNSPNSRTMYENQWDEKNTQAIYWGNYTTGNDEFINIYCPDNPERGFARYKVNPKSDGNSNVAETIVKTSEIGVQWGASGKPYTFYAFYPADRASTTLENGNTIRATVGTGQSPTVYKYAEIKDGANSPDLSTLTELESFKTYNEENYNPSGSIATGAAKTIYGMPDMNAAVMLARKTMAAEDFGKDVPLQFKVLADVLDISLNGPVRPNTLNTESEAQFIQIQAVTIEVVTPVENNSTDKNGNPITDVSKFETDNTVLISGSFDLNMADGTVSNISGNSTVQLQTSMSNKDGSVYYPTLFVRKDSESSAYADLDHLRLRAFLIPGQITGSNLNKLRVHLQTNCGDFYQMLKNDGNFATGQIYPVKFGYFKVRGADFDLKAWIGQLNPNIYLSELSIPGAWHASNAYYQGADAASDLQKQYQAGVRAFEVHTCNGLVPYTDYSFGTRLTSGNVSGMEFYDKHLDETTKTEDPTYSGGSWNTWGTNYSNATVTQRRTIIYYQLPKLALRLFRSAIINSSDPEKDPESSFSDRIIRLSNIMNKDGLIFLELGHELGYNGVTARNVTVPCRTVTRTQQRVRTGVTLSGAAWNISTNTLNNALADVEWTDVNPENPFTTSYSDTYTLNSSYAWPIAVESCLNRLKNTTNITTNKPVIYHSEAGITATTTIRDVQGQIIVKVNTNDDDNETVGIGWSGNTPALFSRWISGSAEKPLTINLQWGAPIAPYDAGTTDIHTAPLQWCFSELDKIDSIALINRKAAIISMNTIASENYKNKQHNTFYETSLGGFYKTALPSESSCLELAKELNPFALGRISNPSREAVPLGLVFMNYVIPPTGQEDTYHSSTLIRAIINNNKAFLLNRADLDTPAQQSKVEDKTNSNFTNNTKNPLK